jgi:hypothetical protein
MGMDILGKNPRNEAGEDFRYSIWSWPPLANYINYIAPHLFKKLEYPFSNGGSGLNNEDSMELARLIRESLKNGQWEAYNETLSEKETGWSTQPDGSVKITGYSKFFEKDRTEEFALFLEHCGGFEIW